ncbi:hypothetical protein GCM10027610_047110 [Dactylosporangium cerinum]
MVQLTGMVGQLGALSSAVPLVVLLRDAGWTATFVGAAGLGAAAITLVAFTLKDSPEPETESDTEAEADTEAYTDTDTDTRSGRAKAAKGADTGLKRSWEHPGTRLGLWTHFVAQFSGSVFALLWGYPFLTQGEGLDPATAALLLSLLTVGGIVLGPVVGHFCGRLPYHRSTLVLGIVASSALAWTVVLLWPGRAPVAVLTGLVLVLAVNGPGSMIGFDYARSFNPAARIGGATGIVNVGGFAASIVVIIGIGVLLDLQTRDGAAHPTLGAYKWAFAIQYLLWGLGAAQVWRYRRTTRRIMRPEHLAAMRRGEALPVTP